MTYTVLGASGFIGGRIHKDLVAAGEVCFAPGRGDESVFSKPLGKVFYCIGLTNDFKDRPYNTVEAHVGYLNKILEKSSFDRLVYLSSTRLYDGLTGDINSEDRDLKLNSTNPRHLYDLSKALGENLSLNFSGGKACVARLSSVYDDGPLASGFMPDLLRRLVQNRNFELNSASGIVRDYIHIDDVTHGLTNLLNSHHVDIVNIASGENVSNQDIVDELNKVGCIIKLAKNSQREMRPVCDITKLNDLGVMPIPVRTFLQKFIAEQV